MKTVEFKIWENKQYKTLRGYFHKWGTEFIEHETGFTEYTVAIVETTDGQVYTPLAKDVKFIYK